MLHHVELYVSNLEEARAFWGWLLPELGWKLEGEFTGGITYGTDDYYITLVQVAERHAHRPYHRCAPGLNHLAFKGTSRAQVDALTAEMERRGIVVLYRDRHPCAGGPDYYAVYCEGPDRLKVEVVAP